MSTKGRPPGDQTGGATATYGDGEPRIRPSLTLHDATDRPWCEIVSAYCEGLGWLRREPPSHATVCCRHYWGDYERTVP